MTWIRRHAERFAVWLQRNAERFAVLAGVALMVAGVWQMHEPAAMILAGALMFGGAIWRRK